MDQPFPASKWVPSRPLEAGEEAPSNEELSHLVGVLNLATKAILQHPYDPRKWLRRARTLHRLRYPELAVGDAHKAALLCTSLLEDLYNNDASRLLQWRLGSHMGFRMLEIPNADGCVGEENLADERDDQREYLTAIHRKALEMVSRNLVFFTNEAEGRCVLVTYPWMRHEHTVRSDELIATLNAELQDRENRGCEEQCCEVRRYAFGRGVGVRNGEDALGIFSTRKIAEGEVVVVDKSRCWGCNGPGTDGTTANLSGGNGCGISEHPNDPEEPDQDLRWIRNRCGKKAADSLVKCRFLLAAIANGAQHPLDHTLIARLTPKYRQNEFRWFSVEHDVAVLDDALQQFGIDIFANLNWDTWIFFVLMARVDNNAWSNPQQTSVNQIFSLFNHSCEPNVNWAEEADHRILTLTANRNIDKGEQLFVCYDGFMTEQPLEVRQQRFQRWLGAPCICSRCVREKIERRDNENPSPDSSLSTTSKGDWDLDERPVFPEDGM